MKKILILVLILIFAGAVLSRNTYAAEEQVRVVDYELPYPGILPDSPFYIIKNARDQVMGLLVMGPVNKSFYDLFMSDKRLWSGLMLINNGNDSLGATTLYISEEYFSKAVDEAVEAEKEGFNVSELGAKLLVASAKHEEVLEDAVTNVTGDDLSLVAKAQTLNANSRNRVITLTTKK